MTKLLRLLPFFLMISVVFFYPVTNVFAVDSVNNPDVKEVDISLSPTVALFDVNNMKPGDWAPRTMTVKNAGSKDFVYKMELRNTGETKMFNEMLLEIKADEMELYTGKLAEFKSLPERNLTSGSEENLDITIRFPEHLGNEFQGLNASFDFYFTAEGKGSPAVQAKTKGQIASSDLATNGFTLPSTSTNIFTLMLIGSILIASGIAWMIVTHYRRTKLAE